MDYIILSNGSNDRAFICRLGNDGTYTKIAEVWNGEDGGDLVRRANVAIEPTKDEEFMRRIDALIDNSRAVGIDSISIGDLDRIAKDYR